MRWRKWLALAGILLIITLLAFPLREAVYQLLVLPMAYLLWLLQLLYLAMSQVIWWVVLIVIVAIILGQSLLIEFGPVKKSPDFKRVPRGNVEALAISLQKADRGIYFKWQVANRLGKLAHQILLQREHGKPRSVFAPLSGEGWEAEPGIQHYLEKGLQGSFAEFPNKGYFGKPGKTPLDHDVHAVMEFLESKIEQVNRPPGHGDTGIR